MDGRRDGQEREALGSLGAVLRHLLSTGSWSMALEGGCTLDAGLSLFEQVPFTREELSQLAHPHGHTDGHAVAHGDT
ncbi:MULTISPECIES: hypothetical protein [Myxococcaceae]|uniref:hypothetical protein n=1 Tax=Myxococcaceae TaxID=31 RepID=UPI00188FF89C|nr:MULTISPECIES: hypothetical protein [Myxococcaceae]MBF5043028.1 hypothetical protein [Simulacricoccus sp. 17bor-14]